MIGDSILEFLAEMAGALSSAPFKSRWQWILAGALVIAALVIVGIAVMTKR